MDVEYCEKKYSKVKKKESREVVEKINYEYQLMESAHDINEYKVMESPGKRNIHPLKHEFSGMWAVNTSRRKRMIFEPTNSLKSPLKATAITIVDFSLDYHKGGA